MAGINGSKEGIITHGHDPQEAKSSDTRAGQRAAVKMNGILIADSDPTELALLKETLSPYYDIETSSDPETSLEKLRAGGSSLLICADAPGAMPALELLSVMHTDSALAQMPALLITEENDAATEDAAFDLGAGDVIKKPLNMKMLLKRVRNIFNIREAAQMAVQNRLYEQKLEQQKIVLRLMEHDELTGLYSRQAFYSRVLERLKSEPDKKFMMIRWDIDQFAAFNDNAGAAEGDRLLKTLGSSLLEEGNPNYTYARLESDNFVLFAPIGTAFPENLLRRLNEWSESFAQGYAVNWRIGVYYITDVNLDPAIMCDRALLAIHSTGKSYTNRIAVYDDAMRNAVHQEQLLTEEMLPALKSGQFEVYYQPQFNYTTGELVGAEALVRWNHPTRGLLAPGAFIPLFEHNGLISKLDAFVWEEVCRQMREWMKVYKDPHPVSVNVSRIDIYRKDLVDTLCGLVKHYRIPIEKIRLEITESAYMKDAEKLQAVVRRLSEAGFLIEMDDFGSAYSSLNMLKDIPVDILKLDLAFLSSTDPSTAARGGSILSSVVRMARWLRLPIIAEGVETKDQADYLSSVGCLYMQGYYFSRPVPRARYEELFGLSPRGQIDKYKNISLKDAELFWNASAQTSRLFSSYAGGAALMERAGEKLELIRANDRFFVEIGTTRETYAEHALDMWKRLTPSSRAALAPLLDDLMESGGEKSAEIATFPSFSGDESTLWLRIRARLVAKNVGSEIYFIWIENINDIKKTEQKLVQREDELLRLYNAVPCGIAEYILKDGRAYMTRCNVTACELLGYPDFARCSKAYNDAKNNEVSSTFVYPDDLPEMAVRARETVATGRAVSVEARLQRRDGVYRWFDIRMQSMKDEEGRQMFQTAFIDIEDRKQAEN